MPNLTIMVGPPGCGKSIWSKLYVESHRAKRVNRDDIRNSMQNGSYSADDEKVIKRIRDYTIESWLQQGYDVVVDDTNLTPDVFPKMVEIANRVGNVGVKEHVIKIERELCLYNNLHREKGVVPEERWNEMWFMYENFKKHDDYYAPPKQIGMQMYYNEHDLTALPKAVIVDLDNTIAMHPEGRDPYDHSKIPNDIPNTPLIDVLNHLYMTNNTYILIVTGRSEKAREDTIEWLKKNGVNYNELYMRPLEEPDTKDFIIKTRVYEEHIKNKYFVIGVFEDREQTTAGWRALNLPVYQVDFGRY